MTAVDPAAVMAAHVDHVGGDDSQCVAPHFAEIARASELWDEHCAAYLTAEALAVEQAKTRRCPWCMDCPAHGTQPADQPDAEDDSRDCPHVDLVTLGGEPVGRVPTGLCPRRGGSGCGCAPDAVDKTLLDSGESRRSTT